MLQLSLSFLQSEPKLLFRLIYSSADCTVKSNDKEEWSKSVALQHSSQDLEGFCLTSSCANLGPGYRISGLYCLLSGTPYAHRISINLPLLTVSKALRKSMQVRMQGRLFPLAPSISRRSATICPMVDLFCLKPFWEMRGRGSRIGLSLFRIMRLYSFMTTASPALTLANVRHIRHFDQICHFCKGNPSSCYSNIRNFGVSSPFSPHSPLAKTATLKGNPLLSPALRPFFDCQIRHWLHF